LEENGRKDRTGKVTGRRTRKNLTGREVTGRRTWKKVTAGRKWLEE
jgi:hypothetical protein